MINLKAKPFYLEQAAISWVEDTLKNMSVEEKIGQLFCMPGASNNPEALERLAGQIGVGGIMYRPSASSMLQETHRTLQNAAKIPLLIAGKGSQRKKALRSTAK